MKKEGFLALAESRYDAPLNRGLCPHKPHFGLWDTDRG